MSLPPPQSAATESSASVVQARAACVALRLLAGSGTASFVIYRRDADLAVPVPAHCLTPTGQLVVAHVESDVPGGATGVAEVRIDIRREATEAQTRILAATGHLLGRIEWPDSSAQRELLESSWMSESVRVAAGAPNAVLGLVRAERVLVHDGAGVAPLALAQLVGAEPNAVYPRADEEFEAHEIVAGCGPDLLYGIYAATLDARRCADVLSERVVSPACAATIGRIFCVDVDALGLTLMYVGASATRVVFVPFPEPAHGHAQLRDRLVGLHPAARS